MQVHLIYSSWQELVLVVPTNDATALAGFDTFSEAREYIKDNGLVECGIEFD